MPPNANASKDVTMRCKRKSPNSKSPNSKSPNSNNSELMCCDAVSSKTRRITRSVARKNRDDINANLKSVMKDLTDPYSFGYVQIISAYNLLQLDKTNITEPEILQEVINDKFGQGSVKYSENTWSFDGGLDFKRFFYHLSGFIFYENIQQNVQSQSITKNLYVAFRNFQDAAVTAYAKSIKVNQAQHIFYYLEEEDLADLPDSLKNSMKKVNDECNNVIMYRINSDALDNYLKAERDLVERSDVCALLYKISDDSNVNELNFAGLTLEGGAKKKATKSKATKPKTVKATKPVAIKPKATKPKATKPKTVKATKAVKPKAAKK